MQEHRIRSFAQHLKAAAPVALGLLVAWADPPRAVAASLSGLAEMGAVATPVPPASTDNVHAAVLPGSRSIRTGTTGTVFASIVNAGPETATGCQILGPIPPAIVPPPVPLTVAFQATDPATNVPIGQPNTPVDIAPGGSQSFVVSITADDDYGPTDLPLNFFCGPLIAPNVPGVNTIWWSNASEPTADVVAATATPSNDGIVEIDFCGSACPVPLPENLVCPAVCVLTTGAFAAAALNAGTTETLTVTADTGTVALPLDLSLCETDARDGRCVNPLATTATSITTTMPTDGVATFSVFANSVLKRCEVARDDALCTAPWADLQVPFDPARNRIFLTFTDPGGMVRGRTSVAVRTR